MEQIRVERIPLVLQTNVHTTYTTVPFCTGREIRTLNKRILSPLRLPFRHSRFLLIHKESDPNKENQSLLC